MIILLTIRIIKKNLLIEMKKEKTPIIMAKNDYKIIMHHLTFNVGEKRFSGKDVDDLEKELKKAKVIDSDKMPPDVVRLNSRVTIRDEKEGRMMELMESSFRN